MFELKSKKLEDESRDFLTHSMNISTSSVAKGAFLSVLQNQGGLIKGVERDISDCGSSISRSEEGEDNQNCRDEINSKTT